MRRAARIALAIVVLLVATIVLPRPAVRNVVPEAVAQVLPTPTLPNPLQSPTPKDSPTPKETPTPPPPDDDGNGGGGNNGGNDGGNGGNDGGGGNGGNDGGNDGGNGGNGGNDGGDNNNDLVGDTIDKVTNAGKQKAGDPSETDKSPHESGNDRKSPREAKKKAVGHGKGKVELPTFVGTFTPQGAFNSEKLVAIANELRSLGMPMSKIMKKVYAPFIIGGKAAWTNTWGAPRYGPGPIVRTHEGQDVFCTYGDPVLASEAGVVEYGDGLLGGRVARLFRPDGSYWYYAHLSDWNNEEFPEGSQVEAGDIIGFCGNTGNAITTPSHVHFGWYQGVDGKAKDPMGYLVRWLRQAQGKSLEVVYNRQNKLEKENGALTAQRRFGDAFVPKVARRSPGAFEVASATLVTGVSKDFFDTAFDPAAKDVVGTLRKRIPAPGSPEAQLDAILEETGHSSGKVKSLSPLSETGD